MKKKYLLTLITFIMMFVFTACVKKEDNKVQEPLNDVNSLIDKYVDGGDVDNDKDGEKESESEGSKAVNITNDKNDKDDKLDEIEKETEDDSKLDMLDDALINEIVASGGSVMSGEDDVVNVNVDTIGNFKYNKGDWKFYENDNGMMCYERNNRLQLVTIYAFSDPNLGMTPAEIVEYYEIVYTASLGTYLKKSTYTNRNGLEFVWYKFSESTINDVLANYDLFIYTDGVDTVIVGGATNYVWSGTTEAIYDFVDSVKYK